MNFTELEELMIKRGVKSLADIARELSTTPQAVSNWKARNQVPYHVVAKLRSDRKFLGIDNITNDQKNIDRVKYVYNNDDKESISLPDIFVALAKHLKIIIIFPFIAAFLTFIYVEFIRIPTYQSWATILFPESQSSSLGSISGLASQFGVNIPQVKETDLSSPSLIPELLRSRSFAEKILFKEFFSKKYDKKMTLLNMLTAGDKKPKYGKNKQISYGVAALGKIIELDQYSSSSISTIRVSGSDPLFCKELAEVIIDELESLNLSLRNRKVRGKIKFIEERIFSVKSNLFNLEENYKKFKEQNRQILSPALELENNRLEGDLDIQKGVYLTLKQQLELAKIEAIQESSILQILDKPQIPIAPSNKNAKWPVIFAVFLGLGFGIILAVIKNHLLNADMAEKKKIRLIRTLVKRKIITILDDYKFMGLIMIILLIGYPFFLSHKSINPVYFGIYSSKAFFINLIYSIVLMFTIYNFIRKYIKSKNRLIAR